MIKPQPVPIEAYLAESRADIEIALAQSCDYTLGPLAESVRYSLLAGGKRLRPILVLAAAAAVGGDRQQAMPTAVAFEILHTQSLIYDDLPCMDDDDLRRGKPTNHKMFGEATAVLAGDAMITHAVARILTGDETVPAERRLAAATEFTRANGIMCQGQYEDLRLTGGPATPEDLSHLHRLKTGALIAGSLRAGAWIGGGSPAQVDQLGEYGLELGLAFQIVDDVLDASATAAELGKTPGKDLAADKATYPKFFGLDGARQLAVEAGDRALAALAGWDDRAEPLRALVAYVLQRRN